MAIIHLVPPLPTGSSSLPGSAFRQKSKLRRAASCHFPIWPCTARSLPGRDLLPNHAGGLLPHPFTLCPDESGPVYSLLHLSSQFPPKEKLCPVVNRLAALWCSDFPPR